MTSEPQHIGKFIVDHFVTSAELAKKYLFGVTIEYISWLTNSHQLVIARSQLFDYCGEDEVPGFYELEWIEEIDSLTANRITDPPMTEPNKGKENSPLIEATLNSTKDSYRNSVRFTAQVDVDNNFLQSTYDREELKLYLKDTLSNLLNTEIYKATNKKRPYK